MPKVRNNKAPKPLSTILQRNQMDNLNVDTSTSLSVKSNRKRKLTVKLSPQFTLDETESPRASTGKPDILTSPLNRAIKVLTPSTPVIETTPITSEVVTPKVLPAFPPGKSWETYLNDPLMYPHPRLQNAEIVTCELKLNLNQDYPLGGDIVIKVIENAGNYTIALRKHLDKGIELTSHQYHVLIRELSQQLAPMLLELITYPKECSHMDHSTLLGDTVYASIKSPWTCIHIRELYVTAEGKIDFHQNNGIALKMHNVERLLDLNRSIMRCFPQITETIPCKYTHSDLDAAMFCPECFPGINDVKTSVTETDSNYILIV